MRKMEKVKERLWVVQFRDGLIVEVWAEADAIAAVAIARAASQTGRVYQVEDVSDVLAACDFYCISQEAG